MTKDHEMIRRDGPTFTNGRARCARGSLHGWVIGGALLLSTLGPSPAMAQGGWLGLQLEFEEVADPGDESRRAVLVVGVAENGPADRAGILDRDVLLEISGDPGSEETLERLLRRIDPGDPVEVVVLRAEERIPLIIEAGERPGWSGRAFSRSPFGDDGDEFRIRLDSIREAVRALNRAHLDRIRSQVDSLATERARRQALRPSDEWERWREEWDAAIERMSAYETDALEALIDRFGDWDPSAFAVTLPDPIDWAFTEVWGGAPILIGRRVVAGAEFVDLNPSLGRYFDVEGGALIVDVSERSPAWDAGLEAGDIVIAVNDGDVESVDELRERFARLRVPPFLDQRDRPDDPVVLTVVRDRARMEIELRE